MYISYFPDAYVPWGTNMTLEVFYFVADSQEGVTDPAANVTYEITKIEGNMTNVDIAQIPIDVIKTGEQGIWNITMNTTWTENYSWYVGSIPRVYFRIDGEAVNVTNAWQETSIFIREVRARLDFYSGPSVVYTDVPGEISFNATYYYHDVDANTPIDAYGATTGRYANITFWNWDTTALP